VSPFQGLIFVIFLPRALPWAGMQRPFRAEEMPPFLECALRQTRSSARSQALPGNAYLVAPATNSMDVIFLLPIL